MKIAVDLDDTLCEFVKPFLKEWNKLGHDKKFEDIYTYYLSDALDRPQEEISQFLVDLEAKHAYALSDPLPKAVEVMNRLYHSGHEIYVVTGRRNASEAMRWLDEASIKYEDLYLTREKTKVLKSINADLFIDDMPFNVEDSSGAGIDTLLMDKPWNREVDENDYLTRVFGWEQIFDYIKKVK